MVKGVIIAKGHNLVEFLSSTTIQLYKVRAGFVLDNIYTTNCPSAKKIPSIPGTIIFFQAQFCITNLYKINNGFSLHN